MRFTNKYKLSNKISSGIGKIHLRVLNFKRPKWLKTKKKILKNVSVFKKKKKIRY